MNYTIDQLRNEGVDVVKGVDGMYWLIARYEVDEMGPFESEADAIANVGVFRPALEETGFGDCKTCTGGGYAKNSAADCPDCGGTGHTDDEV